jgi:predicted RNA-binding protein
MVPDLTVAYTDADPKNYKGKISVKDANEAYRRLLFGLVRIFPMDKQMNQSTFDARVEAVQTCLQKRFQPLK